jgi:hypothetical protein
LNTVSPRAQGGAVERILLEAAGAKTHKNPES